MALSAALRKEFGGLRTGRANAALLDNIHGRRLWRDDAAQSGFHRERSQTASAVGAGVGQGRGRSRLKRQSMPAGLASMRLPMGNWCANAESGAVARAPHSAYRDRQKICRGRQSLHPQRAPRRRGSRSRTWKRKLQDFRRRAQETPKATSRSSPTNSSRKLMTLTAVKEKKF